MPTALLAEEDPLAGFVGESEAESDPLAQFVGGPIGLVAATATAQNDDDDPLAQFVAPEPAGETAKAVNRAPATLGHEAMNAVREFGSAAGRYIFNGIAGAQAMQAKTFMAPPAEAVEVSAEEVLLPAEEQTRLREERTARLQKRIPETIEKARYWHERAEKIAEESAVDPALAETIPARLARTGGMAAIAGMEALIPGAGIPLMALHGGSAAYSEAVGQGMSEEEAEDSSVRAAIGLSIFGAVNAAAAFGIAKVLPEGASKVTKFILQFAGQDAANEMSTRALRAADAAALAPAGEKLEAAVRAASETTLEDSTFNALFAGFGAAKMAGRPPVRGRVAQAPDVPPEASSRLAPAPDQLPRGDESYAPPQTPAEVPRPLAETITSNIERPTSNIEGTQVEPLSPGPGAASAAEPLASYEARRFGERFQADEKIAAQVREETGNRYYEPIPNKLTVAEAESIVTERGIDESVRLVRDESVAMEPRVRATLGQGVIKKLNESYVRAKTSGDPTADRYLNDAVDTAEYLSEYGTRLGQGVQSFAIWSRLTPEGMLLSAQRTARKAGVELTPEKNAEIAKLAAEVDAAAEGMPKQEAAAKLSRYMVEETGIPVKDLPLAIYYTHILSGTQTQLVNTIDTALNVFHEVNSMAAANPRAVAHIYAGLLRGFGEGKYDSVVALSEGRRISSTGKIIESPDILEVSRFGEKGGVPIKTESSGGKILKRLAESRAARPLNAYKYVMRLMTASDTVMFRGAEEARAGLLAFRMAEARGAEKAKLRAEADDLLGYTLLPQYREQAKTEGYTGAKAEARATELMIQSRPEALREGAADFAGIATYNHAPRGFIGSVANRMAAWSNEYPALKLFVPFTRIVANVTTRGLDNTPMGYMRALRDKNLSADERQSAVARATLGTTAMLGVGALSAMGAITLHGAGPSSTDRKRQLQAAGWKPYSIQLGDKYFIYTYTPMGLGLSVMANYFDSQRYSELGQKDALTRSTYALMRIPQTVFNQSFLTGMANLFDILAAGPGKSVSALKNFLSSVASGITTPNLLRDINHVFDPVARRSDSIAEDVVRNIPVARLGLNPVLNAYGEPVVTKRNRFFSQQKDDPAWKLVVEKNLRLPVADQTAFQSADDGYEYAKIAGQDLKRYVQQNLAALEAMSDEDAQDDISSAAKDIFKSAREEIAGRGGARRSRR